MTSASLTFSNDTSAATISWVAGSTTRCNLRKNRCFSAPSFLTYHSPSPTPSGQSEAENPLEHQKGADGLVGVKLAAALSPVTVMMKPVGDGVKRLAHNADLKGMVVIRSPRPQLVPFKLHRFGKQRRNCS